MEIWLVCNAGVKFVRISAHVFCQRIGLLRIVRSGRTRKSALADARYQFFVLMGKHRQIAHFLCITDPERGDHRGDAVNRPGF
jgi:hypothetical protein